MANMNAVPTQSFIDIILGGIDAIEKDKLASSITKLGAKMYNLKFQVREVIEDTYVNFNTMAQSRQQLLNKSQSMKLEISQLSSEVEKHTKHSLIDSTKELRKITASMQELSLLSSTVTQFLHLHETFKAINNFRERKEYSNIAKALFDLRDAFEASQYDNEDVEVYKTLTVEYGIQYNVFIDDVLAAWKDHIRYKDKLSDSEPPVVTSSLQISNNKQEVISEIYYALHQVGYHIFYLKHFSEWILNSLLKPIITKGAVLTHEKSQEHSILNLKAGPSHTPLPYETVYENVLVVFHFINNHLDGVPIGNEPLLMRSLGEFISCDLSGMLIEHTLLATIPSHSSELESYSSVRANTALFHSNLADLGILKKDDHSLLHYTDNVELLCADKICRELLDKARHIMKQNLYDMISVGSVDTQTEDVTQSLTDLKPELILWKSSFQFPKCKISKLAANLLELLNDILVQCTESTEFCAVRLFYVARSIIELFCAIVPIHHQKYLDSMPQQVALFHNSCMFLAHSLLTININYSPMPRDDIRSHLPSFVDQISELRNLGSTVFLKHLRTQRNQILDIVRNCGLATLGENSDFQYQTSAMEKAMRQCLRQLEILHSVWLGVLPDDVYSKAMGSLVNSFVDELIIRVVSVEDIPADTASHLVHVFKIISNRAPNIFQEPKEIHRHVKKWEMFMELTLILGTSLRDISDRWANGKGPIARLFQTEQVKQLVRALFQNTDRRAAVLASIK